MKHVIYKYGFLHRNEYSNVYEIEMPRNAKIVKVETQYPSVAVQINGAPIRFWALCDPNQEKVMRKFKVVGTGVEFEEDLFSLSYLNTVKARDGLIWHVFAYDEDHDLYKVGGTD